METRALEQSPLVVIVGPTASGKTTLAIELAQKHNAEIICADSRTIYRGMDIGTAKPTPQERSLVPHWGLDLVDPGERFTVVDFQKYANQKIKEIIDRGKVPFLVGGTGLYVDAVIFDYQFRTEIDTALSFNSGLSGARRQKKYSYNDNDALSKKDTNVVREFKTKAYNNANDRRELASLNKNIIVGITTEKTLLQQRIEQRIEQLLHDGVVEESIILGKKYGWSTSAMTGNIYRTVYRYTQNEILESEILHECSALDRQLAKRQLTWMRRNPYIEWLELERASSYITSRLAHYTYS